MKNWDTLQADENLILTKHYTPGRQGHTIKYLVIHHNAGNLTGKAIWNVWQTRQASAHYQVAADGRITQLVHDRDTAWHAGNWPANLDSIGIEHADITSDPWTVSDRTLDQGAHLVAALCKAYKLGRPKWGVNVYPHNRFSATACPASLDGTQRDEYMRKAGEYYDKMIGRKPAAGGTNTGSGKLDVDGYCGPATIRRWQQVMGTSVDGVVTGQVRPVGYSRPALVSVAYGGEGSELIRAVQRKLKAAGVYTGNLDGLAGPKTIDGMHRYLGVATAQMKPWTNWGYGLGRAIQTRLNTGKF